MAAEVATQLKPQSVGSVSESPFYIPMTGPVARPRRSLKHGDTFIVLDSHGDIGASAGGSDGLFNCVARGEIRYNPMSYHNGSIWPHDNALIALGLSRYGLKHSVEHVFKGLFDAATYMDLWRLPELFCGFRRERRRGPTLYPVACAPQAWASATPFTLLEAALGLEFDAERGEIRLRNPHLPAFLNEVILRELRLRDASVDLRIRRHGDDVSLEVLRKRGQIQVSIVLTH
jgi:hypothetical protein